MVAARRVWRAWGLAVRVGLAATIKTETEFKLE